jgi:hypothetical protein
MIITEFVSKSVIDDAVLWYINDKNYKKNLRCGGAL